MSGGEEIMAISLTRSAVYDLDNDYDTEVDRVDLIDQEEVIAYVPVTSPYRDHVIRALKDMAADIDRHDIGPADSLSDTVPVPNTY
jgi:hypothetical protein